MFETLPKPVEHTRKALVHDMLLDAREHYIQRLTPGTMLTIDTWLEKLIKARDISSAEDPYITSLEMCGLSTLRTRDNMGWEDAHLLAETIKQYERHMQEYNASATHITKTMALPQCPTYLPTKEERKYERLVCGAISHYELCTDGAEIVEWLKRFKDDLLSQNATLDQCRTIISMYNCGTFVTAYQATNLSQRS